MPRSTSLLLFLFLQLWSDGPTASTDGTTVIRWSLSIHWWCSCDQMVLQHPLMLQLWSDGPTASADAPTEQSKLDCKNVYSSMLAVSSSIVRRLRHLAVNSSRRPSHGWSPRSILTVAEDPVMADKLTSQSAVSLGYITNISLNTTC